MGDQETDNQGASPGELPFKACPAPCWLFDLQVLPVSQHNNTKGLV